MNSIEWLLEIPKKYGDRDFLIDSGTGERVTFQQYHQEGLRVASSLRAQGLERGDRVVLILHNSVEFAKIYLGLLYAGLVAVPVNPVFAQKELDYILEHSGARMLITSRETASKVTTEQIQSLKLKHLLLEDWNREKASADFIPFEKAKPTDVMAVVYTSGTTAAPKGVVQTIHNMIENGRLFTRQLGIGPENRFYGILAMTYLGGYYNLLMLPYVAGSSVVLSRAFDARSSLNFWQVAEKNGVNTIWFVPTILSILLEMDRGHEGERFCREKLKLSLIGTAPLPMQLREEVEKRYGLTLYENFGLSETFFISTNSPLAPGAPRGVGRLLPHVRVEIRDPEGNARGYSEEGEIFVATPYMMNGYYDPTSPSGVMNPSQDGWFPTGDMGVLFPNGELFISGRKKDLIIRGGINISPASIETVLLQHPAVHETAVVGVPHAMYGEDVVGVVKLKQGHSFDSVHPKLMELCKESLGAVRRPAHLLELADFPRSSSGKVQKNQIRALVSHKLGLAGTELFNKPLTEGAKPATSGPAPMIPGRVRRSFARPASEIIEKLSRFPTSLISDCMNRMGIMDSSIRTLAPGRPFCGPAFTVEEIEGNNLMSHVALEMIEAGDILVIDAKGITTRSAWGGLQTLMAKQRKAGAIVVNGTIRDLEEIERSGVPVYALGASPGGPIKGWGGNINHPVACGGVVVNPGDIVAGDDDGVVVIPKELAQLITQHCESRQAVEKTWFEKVSQGVSTMDAVGLRSKLSELGIRFDA